jgi:hypothetical protein
MSGWGTRRRAFMLEGLFLRHVDWFTPAHVIVLLAILLIVVIGGGVFVLAKIFK